MKASPSKPPKHIEKKKRSTPEERENEKWSQVAAECERRFGPYLKDKFGNVAESNVQSSTSSRTTLRASSSGIAGNRSGVPGYGEGPALPRFSARGVGFGGR